MTQKIRKLSSSTIDQIAAGEVIESPSSVVKELVENALDAGSRLITVEIVGGGFQKIRVVDDGQGMTRADALVCLERHATSKLRSIDDLMQLNTMGFRGEALSSIASISRLTLTTKFFRDSDLIPATRIVTSGQMRVEDAARQQGTTIEVDSLFYNVPARKKFQKSVRAATADVIKVMTKLSLGYPHVSFRLISNGEDVMECFAKEQMSFLEQLQERIRDVLPTAYSDQSRVLEYKDEVLSLQGIIGLPTQVRPNRLGQYLFINHRAVFSPLLSNVMQETFATRLYTSDHPIFVLHLDVNPSLIDVNVHPQKKEVRLTEEKAIIIRLKKAVLHALSYEEKEQELTQCEEPLELSHLTLPHESTWQAHHVAVKQDVQQATIQMETKETLKAFAIYRDFSFVAADHFNRVFPRFAVEDGILMIDRKNALRAIVYHRLLQAFNSKETPLVMQALLFPMTIEVSQDEARQIEMHLDTLNKLGISMRPFGARSFVIESLATFFSENTIESLIHYLLPMLATSDIQEKQFKQIAKRASEHISVIEMDLHQLLVDLLKTSSPMIAPSGKLTIAHLRDQDMNKFFKERPCQFKRE